MSWWVKPVLVNLTGADLSPQMRPLAHVLDQVWAGGAALLRDRGTSVPSVEVRITDDVMAAGDTAREELGIAPEHRTGTERVGGVVAGKTLLDDAAERAIVLLSTDAIAAPGTDGEMVTAFVAAHELMHVVYGAARTAAGITAELVDASSDPWGAAEMVAVTTAEEYRCDELALIILDIALAVTDGVGNKVTFRDFLNGLHAEGLDDVLDLIEPGLPDTVLEYRVGRRQLGDMWWHVARTLSEFLVLLAHAQATTAADEVLLEHSAHPAAALIEPAWTPLVEHLLGTRPLPAPTEWAADRQALRDIGRSGLVEVWRRLGLRPRPEGETFYLEVTAPPSVA